LSHYRELLSGNAEYSTLQINTSMHECVGNAGNVNVEWGSAMNTFQSISVTYTHTIYIQYIQYIRIV